MKDRQPTNLILRASRYAQAQLFRLGFEAASKMLRMHPKSWGIDRDVEVIRNLQYAENSRTDNRLDVYRPKHVDRRHPVLLYIHGGGFRILSKDSHWMMAYLFAQRGFVVFTINYRLAPKHPYPEGLEDVCLAAEWIHENAERFGADNARWVVAGESAGANLAMALTIANSGPRSEPFAQRIYERNLPIEAVLPACGIFQVTEPERFLALKPDMPKLFQNRLMAVCKDYHAGAAGEDGLASPLTILESDWMPQRPLPPTMAIIGTADPIEDDSYRLQRVMDRRGVPCELKIYEDGIHAFHAVYWSALGQAAWADQFAFLDRHVPLS
ncbi:MAG: alpha/beta hydrolase [Myxococcota bacterium]|nr:alpha/beta hydrolase [Myxococcota bacterium]